MAHVSGDRVSVLQPIAFESGSDRIRATSEPALVAVATLLRARVDVARVQVAGHTDDLGRPELNRRLSLRRASAVVAALVARGVARDRLDAQGYGAERPVEPNDTEAGRAANRRVELEIVEWRSALPASTDKGPPPPTELLDPGLDAPPASPTGPPLVPMQDPGFERNGPSTPSLVPMDDPGFNARDPASRSAAPPPPAPGGS